MLRADKFNRNRSKIFQYTESNCSKIFDEYPEFDIFLQIELCQNYDMSLKIGKIVVMLSSLYDTYLPYGLYGPPLLPVIIMGITSFFLFYANLINDQWTMQILELTLIIAGFGMIIGQYVVPNFDTYLKNKYLKVKRWLLNDRIYDNIHLVEARRGE
ncbi:unnamed protein product [Didymodactylos carnosus]|uniref:Uncharacterized protein n=1 Tax=Didymodactylos carnosus TaxID=1234261 RepID=A0A8S2GAX9_9BILA|nr:unnamed protein product [Didymodactylos carnosus]CAF4493578.1 unnamed protein product [Didymodactylos carnosus]